MAPITCIFVTLLALASSLRGSSSHVLRDEHLVEALQDVEGGFLKFLSRFRKNYTGAEFRHRLRVFSKNIVLAAKHQSEDPTAVHGITKFSDLTPSEFRKRYLGLRHRPLISQLTEASTDAPTLPTDDLPEAFDWREHGAVTHVKNQGMCGSCYAFSAVGAVEGAHFLKTGQLVSLSEQQIVDCDRQCDPEESDACDAGCQGGLMNNVLAYVESAGGLQTEADYPYRGREGTCQFDENRIATTVQGFVKVPVDEKQILANLVKYGPLAVALNAAWLQSYVRGVSCPLPCDRHMLDHGVLLVGYGKHGYSPARLRYKDFWTVKNSWGKDWGEHGFFRICSGRDECGVDTMVSAVVAVDGQSLAVAGAAAKGEQGGAVASQ